MNLSTEQIQNLSDLFLSKDDSNTELAFEIIDQHGFTKQLLTEIFVVYKLSRDPRFRDRAAQLLNKHGTFGIKQAMKRKLEFLTEQTIKKNITKYVNSSQKELDGLKFAKALYNKYDLGFAYLMKETDSEHIRSILAKHVSGNTFTLRGKGLTAMPDEFYELTHLEEVDLRGNKISNISSKFKVFTKLRKLNLSGNTLKKIHPSVAKYLPHLEELDLSHNLVEVFPEALGNFKGLRRLDMRGMLNISGLVRKVEIPANFSQLQLTYLAMGRKHGYKDYPFFPEVDVEQGRDYLDLSPLALAKRAFEMGSTDSVYYLLYHAESAYRTKVLQRFYNAETRTLDFEGVRIKYLPPEIVGFDVRVLKMEDTHLGYNFSLVESNDEALQAIGSLSDLEELYLDDNAIRNIPAALFNCKKLRVLSLKDNYVKKLPPTIKAWQALTHLNLEMSFSDEVDFPDEINELPKLKEVTVGSLSFKTDEEIATYEARLRELFVKRGIKLNYYFRTP